VLVFAVGLLGALALTPLITSALHWARAHDLPNQRSSHVEVVPRGGGIAVLVPVLVVLALAERVDAQARTALVVVICLALLGLADDVRGGISTFARLAVTVVVAAVASDMVLEDRSGMTQILAVGVAAVWVAGYTNAFNFMDGINGIAGLHAALAGAFFGFVGVVEDHEVLRLAGFVLAGASLGFLPFNAFRARVFLGDVGSYGLGGVIAVLVVIGVDAGLPPEALAGSLVPYLADTSTTLLRRIARRERWFEAHRQHAYQQLIDQRRSHQQVAVLVAATSALCGVLGLLALRGGVPRLAGLVAIVVVAVVYVLLPRLHERHVAPA
jgi:UDP-GlcNAc:undecaprenyl-phosphate GlcNAc-1-phosphate transferase